MLVGFLLYSFIDIRILSINQWFKIYVYNICLYQYANLMSWYTTPVRNMDVWTLRWIHIGFFHLHWFCRIVIVKESTLYYLTFYQKKEKSILYFPRIYFKIIRCFGYATSICILGSYWIHLFKLKLCWDLNAGASLGTANWSIGLGPPFFKTSIFKSFIIIFINNFGFYCFVK